MSAYKRNLYVHKKQGMDKRAPMLCHYVPALTQNIDVLEFPSLKSRLV